MLTVSLTTKDIERIFSKIDIDTEDPVGKCWIWNASTEGGYGRVIYNGKLEMTHRLIYAWLVEPLPQGVENRKNAQVDHICRNRKCCNPNHLEVVTTRENMLRGESLPSINFKKTHCIHGHKLPEKTDKQERHCKICNRLSARRSKSRRKTSSL